MLGLDIGHEMHQVRVDKQARLIHFTVTGFVDAERSKAFDADLRAAVHELCKTGTPFDVLADLRDGTILPQVLTEITGEQMLWLVKKGLRKSANLLSSSLYALQLKRISPNQNFRYFTDEEEAREWLRE